MRFLDELEGLASSQINVIKTFVSMTRLEAKLAGLSIYPFIINVCLLLMCLVSVWLTSMVMFGYGLMLVFGNVMIAMACVLLFNVLVLGLLFRYLLFNLKNMSFEKTRAYLSRGRDEFKKTADHCNRKPGQAIMEPTKPTE